MSDTDIFGQDIDLAAIDDGGDNLGMQQEDEKLNELLFCAQGIGRYADLQKTKYERDEYWEANLKDIHRFLMRDDPENPMYKYAILNWDICGSDIIPLMIEYQREEKLVQFCLVIFVDLLETLPDVVERRQKLSELIYKLNQEIIQSEALDVIARTMNDLSQKLFEVNKQISDIEKQIEDLRDKMNEDVKKASIIGEDEDKIKEDYETKIREQLDIKKTFVEMLSKAQSLVELILIVYKDIIGNYNRNNIEGSGEHYSFLFNKMLNLKIFDSILYYASLYNSEEWTDFAKRISVSVLGIISNISHLFSAPAIFTYTQEIKGAKPMTELQRLLQKEEMEKQQRAMYKSTRPNAFGTTFCAKRELDGSSFVVTNANQLFQGNQHMLTVKSDTFKGQKKKPNFVRTNIFRNKKTPPEIISQEVKLINDTKLKGYFAESTQFTSKDFKKVILKVKDFFKQFIETSFNRFIFYFYIQLGRQDELSDYDIYDLFTLMTFCILFSRYYQHEIKKGLQTKEEEKNFCYDFSQLESALSGNMINYAYEYVYNYIALNSNISERKMLILYPMLEYFTQVAYVSGETRSNMMANQNNINLQINVGIMDNFYTKDFSKIIRGFFNYYNEEYEPWELLYDVLEFSETYLRNLEHVSKRRQLKITQKNRKKKQRKKKKKDIENEMEVEDEIKRQDYENPPGDGTDNNPESYLLDEEFEPEEDRYDYIERDIDIKNESRCLVDYTIIDKIINLFVVHSKTVEGEAIQLTNRLYELQDYGRTRDIDFPRFIHNFMYRVSVVSDCYWIFWHARYLLKFDDLLFNRYFTEAQDFKGIKAIIEFITGKFFDTINKNSFLGVEAVFKFRGMDHVNDILTNYEERKKKKMQEKGLLPPSSEEEEKSFVPEEGEKYYSFDQLKKKKIADGEIELEDEEEDKKDKSADKSEDKSEDQSSDKSEDTSNDLSGGTNKKGKGKKKKKKKAKKKLNNKADKDWTKEEDLLLVTKYFEFENEIIERDLGDERDDANLENFFDEAMEKISTEVLPQKSLEMVHKRLKRLKARKGIDKAKEMIGKLYGDDNASVPDDSEDKPKKKKKKSNEDKSEDGSTNKKPNEDKSEDGSINKKPNDAEKKEKEKHHHHHHKHHHHHHSSEVGIFSECVYELGALAKSDQFKAELEAVINMITKEIDSIYSKREITGENMQCILIPSSETEIKIFKDTNFIKLLTMVGFKSNSDGFMYLEENMNLMDMPIVKEKLEKCLASIKSEAEQGISSKEMNRMKKKEDHVKRNKNSKKRLIGDFIKDGMDDEDEMPLNVKKNLTPILEEGNEDDSVMKAFFDKGDDKKEDQKEDEKELVPQKKKKKKLVKKRKDSEDDFMNDDKMDL
ncbi:MAG: timeless family protein, partial [archaeon]|nr:timeless family protein [archaeon]